MGHCLVASRTSPDAGSVARVEVAAIVVVAAIVAAAAIVVNESAAEMQATRRPFIVAGRDNYPEIFRGMKNLFIFIVGVFHSSSLLVSQDMQRLAKTSFKQRKIPLEKSRRYIIVVVILLFLKEI